MKRLFWLITGIFLLCLTVYGLQSGQAQTPQTSAHSFHTSAHSIPHSLPQLKQRLELLLALEKIPGLQIALFDEQGIYWQQALGTRDIDKALPVEQETLFRGGSTTKTFIALAIMQLAGQGRLTLQDKLTDLAPEVKIENPWQATHPVKLVHLLEHSAGLDDMHFRNIYNTSDPGISLLDAVNRDAGALKVRWQPGTRHAYSNPGYGVLGYIIEKFSGQSFEQYIRQHILQPLAMQHSTMGPSSSHQQKLSQGYSAGKAVPYRDIYLRSAGNIQTRAYELALFGHLLLTRNRQNILADISAADILQMEQPRTTLAARAGLNYGYGLGLYSSSQSRRPWLGHGGAIAGFLAAYGYSPAIGQGYALVVNSDSAHIHTLLTLITRYLAKDHPPGKQIQVAGIDAEIGGYYRMVNNRNEIFAGLSYPLDTIIIEARDSEIDLIPVIGEGERLLHVGQQQFRLPGNSHASGVFIKESVDGKVFVFDGQYYAKSSAFAAWGIPIMLAWAFFAVQLTLLYLPYWLINHTSGKLPGKGRLSLRLYPALASVSLAIVMMALFCLSPEEAGQLNWQTLFICIFTLVFAICSLLGLLQLVKMWRLEPHSGARYFSLISVSALVMLTVYGWYFNYIGLSLWSW
ncbi:serine hydrolase domain-containing protein [Thalassomonas sp. RHCl1]|uniref:serine hydrolase domain-containing protein n=1 Tax=Thalassomonas sp. RHCl1 TaxID=2995320 RepID=UPI00248AE3E4|nr:serine hydrolase domain-containing protein [Thalassomonas sp. RHCl1]